ncbi:MAG TPA: hypothetical protein DCM05_09255 [Elusimicrobia bacterium]|nr:hypothetical protein [Elusimicrobiota bacterium]
MTDEQELRRTATPCIKAGALTALTTPALWALGFFYGLSAIFMRAALGAFNDALEGRQAIEMLSSLILFLPTCASFLLSAAGILAFARRSVFAREERPEPEGMSFLGLLLRVVGLLPFYVLLIAVVLLPTAWLLPRSQALATLWAALAWFAVGCLMFLVPAILAAEACGLFAAGAKAAAFLSRGRGALRTLTILFAFMFPARLVNLGLDRLAGQGRPAAVNWTLMGLSSLVSGLAASCIVAALMALYLRTTAEELSRPDA